LDSYCAGLNFLVHSKNGKRLTYLILYYMLEIMISNSMFVN